MRVAALYDVHGNLPALEAVLADPRLGRADLVVAGGDVVSGPMPAACLDLLLELGGRVRFVRGNADREVLARSGTHGAAWCAEQLGSARLSAVASWPLTVALDVTGFGPTLFCHATPRSDEEIVTRVTPGAAVAEAFAGVAGLAVVGHTHVQFDRRAGATRLVNAGSVGMPYEGRRGAFWALLSPRGSEPRGERVELVETAYDARAAAAEILATAFPAAGELATSLLEPPDPAEATAHFEARRGA